jgi:hypothetical protein
MSLLHRGGRWLTQPGWAMLAETDLIALVRHADDDLPYAGPAVEPAGVTGPRYASP